MRWYLAILLFLLHAPPSAVFAQDSDEATRRAATDAVAVPTLNELRLLQQQVTEDQALTDADRKAISDLLQKASEHVTSTEKFLEDSARLGRELEGVADNQRKLEAQLKEPPTEKTDDGKWKTDPAELASKEESSETELASALADVEAYQKEIARRAARRPLLPDLRATVAQQITDVEEQLKAAPIDSSLMSRSGRLRLVARDRRLRVEAELLNQESKTYEATLKLWNLKRDVAERRLNNARLQAETWRKRVATARQAQAEREAVAARIAAAQSHSAVRELAEVNSQLATRNAELVQKTGKIESTRVSLETVSEERRSSLESLKRRAKAAGFSQSIGVLLRVQQSSLPNASALRFPAAERQQQVTSLNVELIEWDAERRALVDIDMRTEAAMQALKQVDFEDIEPAEIERQIRETLTARRNTLSDLIQNGTSQLDELVRLDSLERRYADHVESERAWLAEHVLWVRSTDVLGSQPQTFFNATQIVLSRRRWVQSSELWWQGVLRQRWLLMLAAIPFLLLTFTRSRLRTELRRLGERAEKRQCTDFLLTLRAVGITLLIAIPLPALVVFLGWQTQGYGRTNEPLLAFGRALEIVGWTWLAIQVVRQMCSPAGVGEAHLGWHKELLVEIRKTGRYFLFTQLLPLLVCAYTEVLRDEQLISTYGRVAFLAAMIAAAIGIWRFVNPNGAVASSFTDAMGGHTLLWNTRWWWSSLVIAAPLALAVLSVLGFHYTTVSLTERVVATISVGFMTAFVASILTRWLLMSYRRMAIRRSKERRRQMIETAANEPDQVEVTIQEPVIQLNDINQQVRKIIRVACGAVAAFAIYAIWIDVMPALGFLDGIHLWENRLVTVGEDKEIPWVNAKHLLLFLATIVLTMVASRNIPGLMEIAVLQRLPLDAGARYAASMISRYLIILCGFLLGFHWIGIGWGSVQWLVAAMTVGLGFGLQEIFANFVSGIILLFERPVRVGDTVTISGITGTVTRIQIRATTLLDWDNKELIVPNREFVTGHLINWTLSSPMLRLICPVGVAYGSDTKLATELLYKVAAEEPQILDTPEPVVVFEQFGDNSLNFELRVFVTGLSSFRRLRHPINLAIDAAFRSHGIEIAFPQRDLHIKSLPDELLEALKPG